MEGGDLTETVGDDLAGASQALSAAALDLARCFAAGATMWCVAPDLAEHASHVAVEFVHPVIVGKRALPALHVPGPDFAPILRLASKPGDILVLLAGAGDAVAGVLLPRCEAWGLTSVWMGAGTRPDGPPADHLLWVDSTEMGVAARTGELVLRYHLLWELTHVVFEHPGLVTPAGGACQPDADDHCVTCSDEGRAVEVTSAPAADGTAEVLSGGRRRRVDVSLVDDPRPGDLLLVHAGVAVSRIGGRP
jgi:hypothetical protein